MLLRRNHRRQPLWRWNDAVGRWSIAGSRC